MSSSGAQLESATRNAIPLPLVGTNAKNASQEQVQLLAERLFAFETHQRSQEERLSWILGPEAHGNAVKGLHDQGSLYDRLSALGDHVATCSSDLHRFQDRLSALEDNVATCSSDLHRFQEDNRRRFEELQEVFHGKDSNLPTSAEWTSSMQQIHERQHEQHVILERLSIAVKELMSVKDEHLPAAMDKVSGVQESQKKIEEIHGKHETRLQRLEIGKVCDIPEGQEHDAYTLRESVWDACLLLWFSTHQCDSAMLSFLYMLNLGIQVSMVYLVYANLSMETWIDDDTVYDLLLWRIGVSQRMEFYHSPSNTTLATRVCQHDDANILAGSQSSTFEAVEQYMVSNHPFNGPMLCFCAMLIWMLLIWRELQDVSEFIFAIMSLRGTGQRSSGEWDGVGDNISFSITHVSFAWRFGVFILLAWVRLVVSLWLGLAGMFFLAESSGMGDLILNCMALGFVLDIDELMYFLVPKRISWTLSVTDPILLKTRRANSCGSFIDYRRVLSYIFLLMLFLAMTAVYIIILMPQFQKLNEVIAIMCGGNTNLAFEQDLSNNVMSYAVTAEAAWQNMEDVTQEYDYVLSSVLQAIGLQELPELQDMFAELVLPLTPLSQITSLGKMNSLLRQTREEAIGLQTCLNVDYDGPARAALQATIDMEWCNMTDAYDVWGRCNEAQVRRFCPEACYCHKVSWWHDRSGCPSSCTTLYKTDLIRYVDEQQLLHGACSDTEIHDSVPYQDGNLTIFSRALQGELVQHGYLDASRYPSAAVLQRVKWISINECSLRNMSFSVEDVVADATRFGACNVMKFIDMVFDTNLCDYEGRFTRGLGSIAAFCPSMCNVCSGQTSKSEPDRFHGVVMDFRSRMRVEFESIVKCGYEWIFCGDVLNGTIERGPAARGQKIYAFWGQLGNSYSFKVMSAARQVRFILHVYDFMLSEPALYYSQGGLFGAFSNTRAHLKAATFASEARYNLVVEGIGVGPFNFQVQMTSNVTDCRPSRPRQIQCNDAINVTTYTRFSTSIYPQSVIKFQANAGVKYTFTSCSSRVKTQLVLYDNFLSIPPLSKALASSSSCNAKYNQALTVRIDESGKHHIALEQMPQGWGNAYVDGEVQLKMGCAP